MMENLLGFIPLTPFLGFLILLFFGGYMPRKLVNSVGVGSIMITAMITLFLGHEFLSSENPSLVVNVPLWQWISTSIQESQNSDLSLISQGSQNSLLPSIMGTLDQINISFGLHLDSLSLLMIFVVTFVGSFIALFSSQFMEEYGEERRFFAYMNLFITAMLLLVLADNLLLLYLGWEGVGLCSYLLIGFWFKDSKNGRSARKAFIVTRIGDTFLALGIFVIYHQLGTLNIQEILAQVPKLWIPGTDANFYATLAGLLLLGGACGKSAQIPLHTWLPDAMVGPTPASALIHAATMVTAGVYLIARTHGIFDLSPIAQNAVAIVGSVTLLVAGICALNQRDIKRVLAYSTVSQIGYMFLGLGVGAYTSAMFHFMTHAFFKALLFLGAGVISYCFHHQYDMFKLGGIKKQVPVLFWTYFIGSLSLAALPLISSGFFSKDAILWEAWISPRGGLIFWLVGVTGAFITSLYTFRMIFLTFFGPEHKEVEHQPGFRMVLPLVVLAIFATFVGYLETPHSLGHITIFSHWLSGVLPQAPSVVVGVAPGDHTEIYLQFITIFLTLVGISLAYYFHLKNHPNLGKLKHPAKSNHEAHQKNSSNKQNTNQKLKNKKSESNQKESHLQQQPQQPQHHPQHHDEPNSNPVHQGPVSAFFMGGAGFNEFYDALLVRPYSWLAKTLRSDVVDIIPKSITLLSQFFHNVLSFLQSGQLRMYAFMSVLGTLIILGLVVMS
jgi:NADH-quinone oxidoreductase subunit L